ncbi:MAG: ATP-dependent DNA helicase [Patescibacteria group bacterium]
MIRKKKKIQSEDIEINDDFLRALKKIDEINGPLYITGKAGTGKSTLLKYFRQTTDKMAVVVAPTGIAAINVGGQTIHAFFGFSNNVTPIEVRSAQKQKKRQEVLDKMDILVIDEISMVRADLMDCVDESLRYYLNNDLPFGGKQIVMFGDLYQLPPVVATAQERQMFNSVYKSPYFFDAKAFTDLSIEKIELKKIYRQSDQKFISLLNNIRHNQVRDEDMNMLNGCYQPNSFDSDDGFITLCTTNQSANDMNNFKLSQLPDELKVYKGKVDGDFAEKNFPTELNLQVKISAQVMMLNNDSAGRWVNGSMGQIIDITKGEKSDQDILVVEIFGGEIVEVRPYRWEMNRYYFNQTAKMVDTETIGTFTQYPLRLSWAITIHKSQGKTFDKVIVDIGRGTFSAGQVYVAISRATSLDNLILKRPIWKSHIWTDQKIVNFMQI